MRHSRVEAVLSICPIGAPPPRSYSVAQCAPSRGSHLGGSSCLDINPRGNSPQIGPLRRLNIFFCIRTEPLKYTTTTSQPAANQPDQMFISGADNADRRRRLEAVSTRRLARSGQARAEGSGLRHVDGPQLRNVDGPQLRPQVDAGGPHPPPLPQKLRRPVLAAAAAACNSEQNGCTVCRGSSSSTCARPDVRTAMSGRSDASERCRRTQDVPDGRCLRHQGGAGSQHQAETRMVQLPRRPQTPGPRRPHSPSPSRQRCVSRTYICYLSPPSPTPPAMPPTHLATPSLVRRAVHQRPPSPETPSPSPSPPPRFSSMVPPLPRAPPSPPVPHRPPRCPRKPPPGILKLPGVNCGRTSPRRRGRHVEFLDSLQETEQDNRRA